MRRAGETPLRWVVCILRLEPIRAEQKAVLAGASRPAAARVPEVILGTACLSQTVLVQKAPRAGDKLVFIMFGSLVLLTPIFLNWPDLFTPAEDRVCRLWGSQANT